MFVEADWESGENWLTAWFAQDHERMERLRQPGYSEHADLASRIFGVTVVKGGENEHLYTAGKIVNHGRNYGMGPKHLQEHLEINEFYCSLGDVKEMIEEWRRLNAQTARWQDQTIAQAGAQGFLVNPFGRKRWWQSRDYANKALAYLPASTLAEMMLRVIIALNPHKYLDEIGNLKIKVFDRLPMDWRLGWVVHDSFIVTGPDTGSFAAAKVLREVMEQPWEELGGFHLTVEIKHSTKSWGDVKIMEGV